MLAPAADVTPIPAPPTESLGTAVAPASTTPPVTTSTSDSYIEACALSNKLASAHGPLTILFQAEKLAPIPGEPTYVDSTGLTRPTLSALHARLANVDQTQIEDLIYDSSIERIRSKVAVGAFVAEAGGFAATTTWEPCFAPPVPEGWHPDETVSGGEDEDEDEGDWVVLKDRLMLRGVSVSSIYAERPVYGEFVTRIEVLRRRYLYPILWREALRARRDDGDGNDDSSSDREERLDEHTRRAFEIMRPSPEQKHLLF